MSTSAEIEAAWNTKVFQHASIAAITTKVLFREYTEDSETEIGQLYFGQEINFFECLVSQVEEFGMLREIQSRAVVEVRYYRQKDTDGTNWTATRDAMELVIAKVRSELTTSWNNTIDFYTPPTEIAIDEGSIDGFDLWRATAKFQAVFTATI
jgi:hypothetical protein